MTSRKSLISRVIKKIKPGKMYVNVDGSIIPSPDKRWCGPDFQDDHFYLKSAEREADRLITHLQCTKESRVLDVGCGQGRLPIGILRLLGDVNYHGIDIDRWSIDWCKRYISQDHPLFRFTHLDLYNERYNRKGTRIEEGFHFDVAAKSVDVINLYSVFSHVTEEDMKIYLQAFSRILDDGGKVFFTTFVETDVPDVTINPEGYRLECSGPLHVVRYDKEYLYSILEEYGYSVLKFSYETETDGQSAIYIGKNS
jgi:SAM-dependent methyltransferase